MDSLSFHLVQISPVTSRFSPANSCLLLLAWSDAVMRSPNKIGNTVEGTMLDQHAVFGIVFRSHPKDSRRREMCPRKFSFQE